MERTRLDSHRKRPLPGEASDAAEAEAALVERAREGDRPAFEALVRGHYETIYTCAFRLVGNHEDAEDLAQECFVKAQESLRWFRGEGRLAGWLRRILVHQARDRFRSAGRRPESFSLQAGLDLPGVEGTTGEVSRREFTKLLDAAIQSLPGHLRIPLVLRALEGLDYEEISKATGVTAGTARTQVMKARKTLQRVMSKYVGGGES